MILPLDDIISQYIIDCKPFKRHISPHLDNQYRSVLLNIYEIHILLEYIQNNLDPYSVFEEKDFKKFSEIIKYLDMLYFVVDLDITEKWVELRHIIYLSKPNNAFLIKKIVIKNLKNVFNGLSFNKKLSKTSQITVFNLNDI